MLVGELHKVDSRLADHHGQLAGGEHVVYILIAAIAHLGSLGFKLLGRARHNRYRYHVRWIDPLLAGVVGFGKGTKHLLRRLTGGEVVEHIGEQVLLELNPARRAGGHHRKGNRFVVNQRSFKAAEEFGSFFYDGEVGGKIGVENAVEANQLKRRN